MTLISSGRFAAATSVLALVIAMGGTGYATVKIKGNQIAKNAVTSKTVKNDSLTGNDINESSLGQVPSAATAASAASVGGSVFTKINQRVQQSGGSKVIYNANGLTITATCPNVLPVLSASTSVNGAFIVSTVIGDGLPAAANPIENDIENDSWNVGTPFDMMPGASGNIAVENFVYRNPTGPIVTGTIATDEGGDNNCALYGHIVGTP